MEQPLSWMVSLSSRITTLPILAVGSAAYVAFLAAGKEGSGISWTVFCAATPPFRPSR